MRFEAAGRNKNHQGCHHTLLCPSAPQVTVSIKSLCKWSEDSLAVPLKATSPRLPRNGSFTKCTNSTFPCSCRLKRDLKVSHLGCTGSQCLAVRFSPVASGEDWLWQLWQGWQPWQHWQASPPFRPSPASPPFRQRLGQGHQHPAIRKNDQQD